MERKKVLALLDKAISKWESIASGIGIDRAGINCSLCSCFARVDSRILADCTTCPVKLHTGRNNCEGTPYSDWMEHLWKRHNSRNTHNPNTPCFTLCVLCKADAKREKLFLYHLRNLVEQGAPPFDIYE